MIKAKTILPITLVILAILGAITYFPSPKKKPLRKLIEEVEVKKDTSFSDDSIPFIDLNDKNVLEEQYKKILRYKTIEGEAIRHLPPKKEEEKLRSLADYNVFEDVGIVDPKNEPYSQIQKWFTRKAKQFSSNIILYPFSVKLEGKEYDHGAFLSLNPSDLEPFKIGSKSNEELHINKAKALFDADIAILNINGDLNQNLTNINFFWDAIDWCTYFQSYLGKGTCQGNYDSFLKAKKANPERTFVTWIDETAIKNNRLLNEEGLPRFGIFIVPDYMLGSESIIKSKLGTSGIQNIIKYYNNRGIIFVTGKSGYLFQDFKIIDKIYDNKKLIAVDNADRKIAIKGCKDVHSKDVNEFNKELACVSLKDSVTEVCISSTFFQKSIDPSFETLVSFDTENSDLRIKDADSGELDFLNNDQKENLTLVSHKSNDKNGQIFLLNFNPMYEGGNRNIILNLISSALSKDLYLYSNVTLNVDSEEMQDKPIPAGEAGFHLEINTLIHNLNNEGINNCTLHVFLPENFDWTDIPEECERSNDFVNLTQEIKNKKVVNSKNDYLLCDLGNLPKYEKKNFNITISVLNYKATQMKYNVLILNPILTFYDSHDNKNILTDQVRVNCEAASLLRVAINPDPSSFYPVKGEGQYVDNVVKIENKEMTGAFEVEYVGLIPIVSPLTDGDDQRKTQWNLKIYVDYYNNNTFEVPFKSTNAQDFVYTPFLQGKGAVIVAEWDSPVLPVKETINKDRIESIELDKEVNLKGINIGMITIDKTSEIIRQVNYRISDRFYKLASQRLMVFVDDSTPEGAKTLYGSYENIPKEWKDEVKKDRAKREFIFTRSDIYFYDNENYVNPPNINEKTIFSIDNYQQYDEKAEGCIEERGEARSDINEKGFFTNFEEDKKHIILKPNIWTNELFQYCGLTIIDPTSETDIKNKIDKKLLHMRPVHYIIPNVEEDITDPAQIYGFTRENAYSGYHSTYNSIKFIYVHTTDYTIISSTCIYGGKIIIELGEYKIDSTEQVTIAPDQIAVYEIKLKDNKIEAYFRRGLMSNEQFGKNLGIKINIENLKKNNNDRETDNAKLNIILEEMKYDISKPPTYETYKEIARNETNFAFKSAWSYPALEIKATLNRTLNGYETMEPFSRYGVYIQELNHRTVYGTAEAHNERKPGIVGNGAGFSMISNLGISSIPFIEYVTVGKGQVIPAGTSTSRATWKDIWGRIWHQPLRSVFPDVPPIPPPLKNFMMTTTYEILQGDNQIYEWPSDEEAQVHLHIKLLNNYPKYFEITRCKQNEIRFVPKTKGENHDRDYSPMTDKLSFKLEDKDFKNKEKVFGRQGGYASYGSCFSDDNAIVGGQKVIGELRNKIERAKVCADFTNADDIKNCAEELKDITTLKRVDPTNNSLPKGKKWNYSPLVEKYYPKGYIEDDMWDLTHIDYDDNNMDKAYKYHMDNHLPNYDNEIIKPHNTIAIPIYKGLGFSILYDQNNEMNYHGTKKKGWWGDNLQNKDDTLVAGQETCNIISVDKKSSITNWVEGKSLLGNNDTTTKTVQSIINERNKNIYVCLYNRNRPDFTVNTNRKYFTKNVNQNNIVPIIVDLDKDDNRLTNYKCKEEQFTPENLYTLKDNLLVTPTSKDYLYFAANLRGQAKESFNVLMNLTFFDVIKYEGMVKVNEGGRFVYWNPANGPNSFLVVDDPVSIVNAKRNDIEIKNDLFPGSVPTFDAVVYHSYTFRDEGKINKVWPFNEFYANSYGFGDVSISVYVGGIRKSKAVLKPGQTTYAKIIFYNNCGFDWDMKGDAIKFDPKGKKAISANDLLSRTYHTIQAPLEYRFLDYIVADEYKNYITIEPSDHNIEVAPEFFDFENINVVTIRDGFKGEYNLKINVTDDFPDYLRGKPIEIKIELKTKYFNKFPGTDTDPIKSFHKYTVKVPSVYIGVPYSSGDFEGKVLYTSAQASELDFSFDIDADWFIDNIRYVDQETLERMKNATQNKDSISEMDNIWNNLKSKNITYKEKVTNNIKKVTVTGIKQDYPYFPKINLNSTDEAEFTILVRTNAAQTPYGLQYPINNVKLDYLKWNKKPKDALGDRPFIYGSGPWIEMTYARTLVEFLDGKYQPREIQEISHEEEGVMRVNFKLTNIGNGNSKNTTYELVIENNIEYIGHDLGIQEASKNGNVLTFKLNADINAKEMLGSAIYLRFPKYIDSYGSLSKEELERLPKELKIAKEASAIYYIGTKKVTQHNRVPLTFPYKLNIGSLSFLHLILTGRRKNPNIELETEYKFNGTDNKENIILNLNKSDLTEANSKIRKLEEIKEILYNGIAKNYSNIDDKPNDKDTSKTNHFVRYFISIYRQKGKYLHWGQIDYDQEEIGLSTAEKVLIIISSVFFLVSVIFVILAIRNIRRSKGELETEVQNTKVEQLIVED